MVRCAGGATARVYLMNLIAGSRYYFHPRTGRTTWMSENAAASVLKRALRKRAGRAFRVSVLDVVSVARLCFGAREAFLEQPERVAALVNYSLLLHFIEADWYGPHRR